MKKEEVIARYGEEAWQKQLERDREYNKANKEQEKAYRKEYYEEHREEEKAAVKKWQEEHPEEVIANNTRSNQEKNRKGGKYYAKKLKAQQTGLRGARKAIRGKHQKEYKPYKDIVAPESQIHHEWIPRTAEYTGVALVEADQHMHGFVDIIEILDGKITLLTEEEVKKGKKYIKDEIKKT